MSVLEIVAVLAVVALVLSRWAPAPARRPVTVAALVLVPISAITLALIGLRWQLVPVLVGAAPAVPFALGRLRRSDGRRVRWWLAAPGTAVALVVVALGPLAAWGFPVPTFPEPTGPYPVGTTVAEWTDPDRAEPATPDPGDHRRLLAQFWYPARDLPPDAERAPYLGRDQRESRIVAEAFTGTFGLPGFLVDDAVRARTHAVPDAAPADGRFPVVLFSPGANGVRGQDTGWAEELAGRGYLVVGLDHLYDSPAVVLADGSVVRGRMGAAYSAAWAEADPDAAEDRVTAEFTALRVGDLSAALTELGRLDRGELPGSPAGSPVGQLAGRIDTARAAVAGHSFGGAAAIRTLAQDPRFAAAVDLDGGLGDAPVGAPDGAPTGSIGRPVLAVTGAGYHDPTGSPGYAAGLDRALDLAAPGYRVTVPGAEHLDFTDLPLWLPPVPGVVGWSARATGVATTAGVTAAFLDHVLRGAPGDPAVELARYGELAVHRGRP